MLKVAFFTAVAIVVVLVVYSITTNREIAPIESVRAYIEGKSATPAPTPGATAPEPATPPAVNKPAASPRGGRAAAKPAPAATSATSPAAATTERPGPRVPRPTPLLPPVRVAPPPPRKPAPIPPSHYLPGNTTAWTTYEIRVQGPTVVLSRGTIGTPTDSSGPNGLNESRRESTPGFEPAPGRNERVLDSAPYLSLIGRVCSQGKCSPPFFVGTGAVLCPSELQMTGELQLWTNNYVREQGVETVNPYRTVSGGFYLHGEPAPATSCETTTHAAARHNAPALAPGSVLRKPEFRIAASQTFWKPFFLPLDQPLAIRASGNIEVRGVRAPIAPVGIATAPSGTDPRSQLYAPDLPYGALLGRLCRVDVCDPPFVIGRERTICPREAGGRHLELWINHLISLPKPDDPNRPPTFHIFEWQGRSGEFTFEVEGVRTGCGT
jgi:hypothetical protein